MEVNKFNIRVYGILIDDQERVLLTDELIKGKPITKFPGGGLEFGEGTIDCIKREFVEETGNMIEVREHFYTTDYFQVSAYNKAHQIISIYYLVEAVNTFQLKTTDKVFDFGPDQKYEQTFRWVELKSISEKDLSLAIDKIVGKKLRERFSQK